MSSSKKPILHSQSSTSSSSYNSLYFNPLTSLSPSNKENVAPINVVDATGCASFKTKKKHQVEALNKAPLKPSSLELCMKLDGPSFLSKTAWGPISASSSSDVWDFSDSEAAPASSWSTLPNRLLLCRPLPLDVGTCTCIIVKESHKGMKGISLYSLYTNEGRGRQDRKLAVARHTRQNGRSKFIVAQNPSGLSQANGSDESSLGIVTANLVGSKFQIWDQGMRASSRTQPERLLGVVAFVPTVTTLTGSFRIMKAWIPKQQSMQLKNTNSTATQVNHINGLAKDWEVKRNRAHQLRSREPHYNPVTKRYELDFRERAGRSVPKIQTSVKNFQLTMEENGRQTLVQLGKTGKSKYVMDYRHPLTGYQAFCICLASIDSKLCCSV